MKKKVYLLMTAITLTTVLLVMLASCGQMADVPQGYAKVRVGTPNGRAITADEKQNSRFEYYFNDSRSDRNETVAQVSSRLKIRVVAIDTRNGRQVGTGEKTITVAPGMNNVDILIYEDRGVNANMVRWSAGVATVGNVENIPADESRSPGEVITVPQDPTWAYGDFTGWSYGNAQLVDENDGTISGNLTAGKQFKVPDGGVTLTANWTPTPYTITYNAGSGGSGIANGSFTATSGIVQLNDGTSFSNSDPKNILTKWQANGEDFGSPNESVPVQRLLDLLAGTQSVTLTAKWEALTEYNVTFAEGEQTATSGTMPQTTKSYIGGTISLATKPTATGYDFKGWKVTKTADGELITTLDETANQYTMPGEYEITLTAQWQIKTYSVTYDTGTGGPAIQSHTRTYGQSFTINPTSVTMRRPGYSFANWTWQKAGSSSTISVTSSTSTSEMQNYDGDIEFTAKWNEISTYYVSASGSDTNSGESTSPITLTKAFELASTASTAKTINVQGNITGVAVTQTDGTITLNLNGNTLTGNGTSSVITIMQGEFTLTGDGTITGGGGAMGGGICVMGMNSSGQSASAKFTMENGTITKNTLSADQMLGGAGVCVFSGEFIMNDGTISYNEIPKTSGGVTVNGAGVRCGGSFIMNGGTITNNSGADLGGGVYGGITMNGGTISYNSAYAGGGIYDSGISISRMKNGAKIEYNTAETEGGGVCIDHSSSFSMEGGEISNNTVTSGTGGGVCVVADYFNSDESIGYPSLMLKMGVETSFQKSGGTITANTATTGAQLYFNENSKYDLGNGMQTSPTGGYAEDNES